MSGTRLAAGLLIGATLFALAGCGSYTLRGRVVQSAVGEVYLVNADHRQLREETPVADAALTVTLDPDRLNRKVIAQGRSGPDGSFALPVREFGAGVLEHEVELLARRTGYAPTVGRFVLPGGELRVLTGMALGEDRAVYTPTLKEQTLRDAEPYMKP